MFVQVLRPTYKGPLYHSSSSSDFLSAQAHLQTKDRLWQMEFNHQIKLKRTNLNLKRSDLVVVSMVWELVEVNVVSIFGK